MSEHVKNIMETLTLITFLGFNVLGLMVFLVWNNRLKTIIKSAHSQAPSEKIFSLSLKAKKHFSKPFRNYIHDYLCCIRASMYLEKKNYYEFFKELNGIRRVYFGTMRVLYLLFLAYIVNVPYRYLAERYRQSKISTGKLNDEMVKESVDNNVFNDMVKECNISEIQKHQKIDELKLGITNLTVLKILERFAETQ